ncbi:TNT domain-containing protein [Sphaerimonospora sp. CA-214678]|uniref:TNT domain-containing protein n=1 Tax=Sphaerimonospora sp. CA-214678 TaxID=3240029 RepID=UPI003D93DE12
MRNFLRCGPVVAALALTAATFAVTPALASDDDTGTSSGALVQDVTSSVNGLKSKAADGRKADGAACAPPYVLGNPALGPEILPAKGNLGEIVRGYTLYGGLPPTEFLTRYFNEKDNTYNYPPDFGFAHPGKSGNAKPIIYPKLLPVGYRVDRFGGESGAFLSPFGTPYSQRALPPSNLNTFSGDPAHRCNYHVYEVTRPFEVDAGPIAAAFQQPGEGLQFHTLAKYVPGAPANDKGEVSIGWLADNGYLERLI